jgi:hypothetical protein
MPDPTERPEPDTDEPAGGVTEFLIQFDVSDEDNPELIDVVQLDE